MKLNKIYLLLVISSYLLFACQTAGPVSSQYTDRIPKTKEPPQYFISPIEEGRKAYKNLKDLEINIDKKNPSKSKMWKNYLEWFDAWETIEVPQKELEGQLARDGMLMLKAGHSYSFELESYCVYPGTQRPIKDDEFYLASIKGPASKWLPEILRKQGTIHTPQSQLQYLIWALLVDTKFDELDTDNQTLLLKYYPDAKTRFGNRRLENLGKDVLDQYLPGDFKNVVERTRSYRATLLENKDNFVKLEQIFAPPSSRQQKQNVGWLQTKDGYYIKATSDSYKKVRFDIYVPLNSRQPNQEDQYTFIPQEWIELPEQGQRLASSVVSAREPQEEKIKPCEVAKKWNPTKCDAMTNEKRSKLLELADPKNFPQMRYASPPINSGETDCSHFVYDMYKAAGFEFPYYNTSAVGCLKTFEEIPDNEAAPGDLMLYKKHIGIIAEDGKVISASIGGTSGYSKLPVNDENFTSSIKRYPKTYFGKGRALRWKCP